MAIQARQLTDPVAVHGEGPVWCGRWGGLRWVDMLAGDVLALDEATGRIDRARVGTVAAAIRPRRTAGMIVATERGFAVSSADPLDSPLRPVGGQLHDHRLRLNEGGCDPDGRFYCGSIAWDESPGQAALHRIDDAGRVETVLTGVTVSNGLDWSPDGSLAYYADSATGGIDVFDYDRRAGLTGRRTFVAVDTGVPDGLTVDADGYVWTAIWGGGAVHRYHPSGRLDAVIALPGITYPTACTFGGSDLRQLFITTSSRDVLSGAEPAAGALFVADVEVNGQPVRCYAG